MTDAFERYLTCGDFSRGFVRCHGGACRHDVLVAFSCKQRGLCPSCGARRMCDVAANVTDCILPSAVPVASDAPTMIAIEHWRRLLDGKLYAASSRVEWAVLLRRTQGVDALPDAILTQDRIPLGADVPRP